MLCIEKNICIMNIIEKKKIFIDSLLLEICKLEKSEETNSSSKEYDIKNRINVIKYVSLQICKLSRELHKNMS